MNMLTEQDLKKIGEVVQEKIDEALIVVNKGFTGVETRLTGVETRLTGVETRLTGVETRLTAVEATMVTKDYLDRKLAPINGKINVLTDTLQKNGVITEEQGDVVRMQA